VRAWAGHEAPEGGSTSASSDANLVINGHVDTPSRTVYIALLPIRGETIELRGGTAVVTGGGGGIGRGLALTWAGEGMNVVVADLEPDAAEAVAAEVRERGVSALAVTCDVTDRASVDSLVDATYAEFGEVSVLCNNAGVIVLRDFLEMNAYDWQWTFDVNFFGIVNCVYAFVPRIREQERRAHIVNTASDAGVIGGPTSLFNESAPGRTEGGVYAASKHAAVCFSEQLLNRVRPLGIGVSVFCPSLITSRISEAERNRPASMGPPTRDVDPAALARSRATWRAGAMDPLDAGRLVCQAVKEDRFYIFTDYRVRDYVLRRFGTILEDFSPLAPKGMDAAYGTLFPAPPPEDLG
jgi:NAD(P)-dependent dehydrogenase (short-subunit alcohol dehydrogenase family)